MKICVAQIRPVRGDIAANITRHKLLINFGLKKEINAIFFPELSITGYEPSLAKDLALTISDPIFDDFQELSDKNKLVIGIGMPTQSTNGIHISQIIFQPGQARQSYSKQHLHEDELPFFIESEGSLFLQLGQYKAALAICYEISIPSHAEHAGRNRSDFYLATVAKTSTGVKKAISTLSAIAENYSMTVLMANCVGECEDFISSGSSSIFDRSGKILDQLDQTEEGLLILDVESGTVSKEII